MTIEQNPTHAAKALRTSEQIRDAMLQRRSDHELKKYEITPIAANLSSLIIEIGMVGDEGTAASLLCRDYRHYIIYRGGGVALVSGGVGIDLKYKKQYGHTAKYYPQFKKTHRS